MWELSWILRDALLTIWYMLFTLSHFAEEENDKGGL